MPDREGRGNGKSLFKVKDPEGYEISLDIDTWELHIIVRHPEMKNCLDLVKRTVESPEVVQQSPDARETCFYYRLSGKRLLRRTDLYVSVVVNRNNEEKTGLVRTAHLTRKIRQGGKTLWLKRT